AVRPVVRINGDRPADDCAVDAVDTVSGGVSCLAAGAPSRSCRSVGRVTTRVRRMADAANNSFSFLALADSTDRRDRAAPVARRLATGMGSRVTPPRSIARAVGPARLAQQDEPAVAEHKRILGCAVAAIVSIGGRNVSRLALWRAHA